MEIQTALIFFCIFLLIYVLLRRNAQTIILSSLKTIGTPANWQGGINVAQTKLLYAQAKDATVKKSLLWSIYQLRISKVSLSIGFITILIFVVQTLFDKI